MTTSRSGSFDSRYFDKGVLRRSRELTRSGYQNVAFSWAERFSSRVLEGDGSRALEIGCGLGYVCEVLAERGYSVLGTDISSYAIEEAKRSVRHSGVRFLCWDATTKPPFDGRFHLVVAFEVIEHLQDPERAIRSWCDLLEPGGLLLMTTPNRWGPLSRHWQDSTHRSVRGSRAWAAALRQSGSWEEVRVGIAQWIPLVWKVDHVMRSVALPGVGAMVRILARKRRA